MIKKKKIQKYTISYNILGATSKPNRRLTAGSFRFRAVAIV